jgi:hypothetical protein
MSVWELHEAYERGEHRPDPPRSHLKINWTAILIVALDIALWASLFLVAGVVINLANR